MEMTVSYLLWLQSVTFVSSRPLNMADKYRWS